ncbi:hypothetical protein [Lacunimicrobium album]
MFHHYLAIALTGLSALLLLAATPRSQTDQQILKEIEAMSEPERARLMKNYDRFQKLPADQQARYRALAAEIASSSQYQDTMDTYFRWADNLVSDPYARASLAQQTDPVKRVIRVDQLVEEQQRDMLRSHDMQELQLEHLLHFDKLQVDRYLPFTHDLPIISEADFDKLLETIAANSNIPEAERREFSKLTTVRRAVAILKASQAATKAEAGDAADGNWPSEQLMQKIGDQVKGVIPRWNRGWDRDGKADWTRPIKQRRVQMFVIKNLLAYETVRLLKSNTADSEELEAFVARQNDDELKRPERDETPEQYRAEVIFMYLIKNKPDQVKTIFDEPDTAQLLADWKRNFDRIGEDFLFRGGRGGGDGREDRGNFRPGGGPGGPGGPIGGPIGGPGGGPGRQGGERRNGDGPNPDRRPNGNNPPNAEPFR